VKIDGAYKKSNIATELGTTVAGLANPGAYVLVDCKGGSCKQTQGYLYNGSSVYKFVGTNVGKHATDVSTNSNSCPSTDVGKVYGTSAVCIGTGSGNSLGFSGTEPAVGATHMIFKGEAVANTPFEGDVYGMALKRTSKYIVKDQFFTGSKYKFFI